jgi:hypothetical protein
VQAAVARALRRDIVLNEIDHIQGIRQISMVLGIEASRDLPTEEFQGVSASIATKVSTDTEIDVLDSKHRLRHLLERLSSLG